MKIPLPGMNAKGAGLDIEYLALSIHSTDVGLGVNLEGKGGIKLGVLGNVKLEVKGSMKNCITFEALAKWQPPNSTAVQKEWKGKPIQFFVKVVSLSGDRGDWEQTMADKLADLGNTEEKVKTLLSFDERHLRYGIMGKMPEGEQQEIFEAIKVLDPTMKEADVEEAKISARKVLTKHFFFLLAVCSIHFIDCYLYLTGAAYDNSTGAAVPQRRDFYMYAIYERPFQMGRTKYAERRAWWLYGHG